MIDSPDALVDYLRPRYTLSGTGHGQVELWWKLRIEGEPVVQYQSIHAEWVGADLYIIVASTLHCGHVDDDTPLELGTLLRLRDKVVLAQPLVAPAHDGAHLERIMAAVAEHAATIAHARRRTSKRMRLALATGEGRAVTTTPL